MVGQSTVPVSAFAASMCVCSCAADGEALAVKTGCVKLLAAALKTHSGDASVTKVACGALQNIAVNG